MVNIIYFWYIKTINFINFNLNEKINNFFYIIIIKIYIHFYQNFIYWFISLIIISNLLTSGYNFLNSFFQQIWLLLTIISILWQLNMLITNLWLLNILISNFSIFFIINFILLMFIILISLKIFLISFYQLFWSYNLIFYWLYIWLKIILNFIRRINLIIILLWFECLIKLRWILLNMAPNLDWLLISLKDIWLWLNLHRLL